MLHELESSQVDGSLPAARGHTRSTRPSEARISSSLAELARLLFGSRQTFIQFMFTSYKFAANQEISYL